MKWKLRGILVCLLLGVSHTGQAIENPYRNLESRIERIALQNGMRFLVLRDPDVPVFSAYLSVRVGGVDEEAGKSGLAHMLEHMAFKGTREIGPGEFNQIYTRNGAQDLNAETSKDLTGYFVSLPKNRLELWASLESERFLDPVLREFYLERDVVIQERRERIEHNPDGYFYEHFLEAAYPAGHPYRIHTIGYPQDLAGLTAEDTLAFFKTYYTPDRMVAVLVGDLPKKRDLLALLERSFGRLTGKSATEDPRGSLPKATGERTFEVHRKAQPALLIGYPKPTLPSRDDMLFDLFSVLFCDGETSRLMKTLVVEKQIASEVSCENGAPGARLDNLFLISAKPFPQVQLDDLLRAIDEEIEKVKAAPFEKWEIERGAYRLAVSQIWHMTNPARLVDMLNYYETIAGDFHYAEKWFDVVTRAKSAELLQLAKRYLVLDARVVGKMTPGKGEK